MAVVPRRVSVGTEAVRLDANTSDSISGSAIQLIPQAAGTLILGGDDELTAASGARLPVVYGEKLSYDLDRGEQVWGIVAAGTLPVDVVLVGA